MGSGGGHTGSTGGSNAMGGSMGSAGGGSGAVDCSMLKVCDDFEAATLSSTWKTQNGGFTIALSTDQAHSGKQSVHLTASAPTSSAFISTMKGFPAADFWGRAWMRFKLGAGGHQMYIYAISGGTQLRVFNRLGSNEDAQINIMPGDTFNDSKIPVPQEEWFCYEWHITATESDIFLNGKAGAAKGPGLSNPTAIYLGMQRFQSGGAAGDIWIDDVAIGDKQIGCQ